MTTTSEGTTAMTDAPITPDTPADPIDIEAPFGRTPNGKPFASASAAKRAATIAAKGLPASGRKPGTKRGRRRAAQAKPTIAALIPPAVTNGQADDLLTRQGREIEARLGELKPLVDEYQRLVTAAPAFGITP